VPPAAGRSSGMGLVAAEIGVGLVELAPVRRREEVALVLRSMQNRGARRNTASPSAQLVTESVFPVATNSERPSLLIPPGAQMPPPRPARRPARELLRILQGHAQDPAVILAAVPEVAAERHVDRAVENGQCTPLVLVAGV